MSVSQLGLVLPLLAGVCFGLGYLIGISGRVQLSSEDWRKVRSGLAYARLTLLRESFGTAHDRRIDDWSRIEADITAQVEERR